jgi:hypothetical protein
MFPYSSHIVSGRGTGVLHSTLGRVFLFLFLLLCDNLLPAAQPQRRIGSRAMQKDNRAVESLRRRLFAARLLRFRLFEFVPFLPPLLQITGASHQNQRTRREREKGRERKREREREGERADLAIHCSCSSCNEGRRGKPFCARNLSTVSYAVDERWARPGRRTVNL